MIREITDCFNDIAAGIVDSVLVQRPCVVTKVHSQYLVDVEYYYDNKTDYLYNVPVKHIQSGKAFVFLGLNVGDRGIICFFDSDVSGYGSLREDLYLDKRKHNINDGLFSVGFYPADAERYIFPEGDIIIGTTSGSVVNLTGNNITIIGGNVSVSASSVNLGSNVTIDGRNFLEHQHSNGNQGELTGGVV